VSGDREKVPEWRVTFWFLAGEWTQLGYAFVKAKNEHAALALCSQRAAKRGFSFDSDTKIEIRPETGDGRL
jgi:hypothetical protein